MLSGLRLLIADNWQTVLRNAQFIKHVGTLFTGKASSIIIAFLAMPIIGRLYEPTAFGVFSLFVAIVGFIVEIGPLSYHRAVVVTREERSARVLLWIAIIALTLISTITFIVIAVARILNNDLGVITGLGGWVWLVPATAIIVGCIAVLETWMVRKKEFHSIAKSDIANSLSTVGSRITFGALFGSSIWALMVSYLFGIFMKFMIIFKGVRGHSPCVPVEELKNNFTQTAEAYKDFPLYNAPIALVRSLPRPLILFVFGYLFSPAVVGFYAMADRLVRAPLFAVIGTYRTVYLRKVAEITHDGRSIRRAFLMSMVGAGAIGFLPFMIIWMQGETIITFLMGEKWRTAGQYVALLSPWFYCMWVTVACVPTMVALRRQRLLLIVQIWFLLLQISILLLAQLTKMPPETTIENLSYIGVVGLLSIMLSALIAIRQSE